MSNTTKSSYCNEEIEEDSQNTNALNVEQTCKKNTKAIGGLIIAIGIISCILLFNAGFQIKKGSSSMETLTSQAGNSIAEAYYQDMGQAFKGFSYLCYGLGLAVLGGSIGAGVKKI